MRAARHGCRVARSLFVTLTGPDIRNRCLLETANPGRISTDAPTSPPSRNPVPVTHLYTRLLRCNSAMSGKSQAVSKATNQTKPTLAKESQKLWGNPNHRCPTRRFVAGRCVADIHCSPVFLTAGASDAGTIKPSFSNQFRCHTSEHNLSHVGSPSPCIPEQVAPESV